MIWKSEATTYKAELLVDQWTDALPDITDDPYTSPGHSRLTWPHNHECYKTVCVRLNSTAEFCFLRKIMAVSTATTVHTHRWPHRKT